MSFFGLTLTPARASASSVCDLMRDIMINRKVADVAVVAGIGRPIPVFSFAALKAFNTSNYLHLRLTPARAAVSSVCNLGLKI